MPAGEAPLPIDIDFRLRTPIAEQVREQIRALIAREILRPGDQLPTVRQLAAALRVNFNTIARAYRMLAEEGLISLQHGRGTFVLAPALPEARTTLRQQTLAVLAQRLAEHARALGFSEEEALVALRRAWQRQEPP